MTEELNTTNSDKLEVLWTVDQVAAYLQMKKVTVYRWISEKRMIDPAKIRKIGRVVRIPRSEVERIAGGIKEKLGKPQ